MEAFIEKAKGFFINNEQIVEQTVEAQSILFFERLEKLVSDKLTKRLINQIICAIIGDAYDFFCFAKCERNIFSANIKTLGGESCRKLYKWMSFYHGAYLDAVAPAKTREVATAMAEVFGWDTGDKRLFRHLCRMRNHSDAWFEVVFLRKLLRAVFGTDKLDPVVLALGCNLFYNAHNTFAGELELLNLA